MACKEMLLGDPGTGTTENNRGNIAKNGKWQIPLISFI